MAIKRRRRLTYDVVLEPPEEGGYTAYVPALRGCVSEGDSEEEALDNIEDDIRLWLLTRAGHCEPAKGGRSNLGAEKGIASLCSQ